MHVFNWPKPSSVRSGKNLWPSSNMGVLSTQKEVQEENAYKVRRRGFMINKSSTALNHVCDFIVSIALARSLNGFSDADTACEDSREVPSVAAASEESPSSGKFSE